MIYAMAQPRPVLIAGPTASGKSALALALAERDGGCVINADASAGLCLLARPDRAARRRRSGPRAAPALRPCRLRRRATRSAPGCARSPPAIADARAPRPAADRRRRHRPLPPRADRRAGRHPGDPARGPRAVRGDAARRRARRACSTSWRSDDPATLAPHRPAATRCGCSAPGRFWSPPAAACRTGRARRIAPRRAAGVAAVRIVLEPETSTSLTMRIAVRFRRMLEHGALDECARFLRCRLRSETPAGRVLGARSSWPSCAATLALDAADRRRRHRHPPVRQAPAHLVPQPLPDWQRLDGPATIADQPSIPTRLILINAFT